VGGVRDVLTAYGKGRRASSNAFRQDSDLHAFLRTAASLRTARLPSPRICRPSAFSSHLQPSFLGTCRPSVLRLSSHAA
jgi:hypothetical protein